MKIKIISAAALLALGGAAFAQSTPPTSFTNNFTIANGTLPIFGLQPTFRSGSDPLPGSFTDRWNFMFPATGAAASASSVSLSLDSVTSISGLSLRLFTVTGNTLNGALGSLVAQGTVSGQSATLNNVRLNPGAYYAYVVSGTDTGVGGGSYSFTASASPVPEPETYALFLAGLAAIGFVARRRVPSSGMAPAAA